MASPAGVDSRPSPAPPLALPPAEECRDAEALERAARSLAAGRLALRLLSEGLLSRGGLSALGKAIVLLVGEYLDPAGAPQTPGEYARERELYYALWWSVTIAENEQNWQSPSSEHSLWASRGYNNLGGSYRRYSLGEGTAATFPQFGERRLLFAGHTGFLSAVKAVLFPYHRDRRLLRALLAEQCRPEVKFFASRVAAGGSVAVDWLAPGRAPDAAARFLDGARAKGEASALVLSEAGDLDSLAPSVLSRFDHIIAACPIGRPVPEEVRLLPNVTLCYSSVEVTGYRLEIVVPQQTLRPVMVRHQQRGGAITEEALKLFLFLLGGPGVLASLAHERSEDHDGAPLTPVRGRTVPASPYVFRLQARVRGRLACQAPAPRQASRFVKRLAALAAKPFAQPDGTPDRDRLSKLQAARRRENALRAQVYHLALADFLCGGMPAKRVSGLEAAQASYHNLHVLSRQPGFPATETLLFNCGMAGCAAAVEYLALAVPAGSGRPVLFGRQSYNENEWLVRDLFPDGRVVLFELDDLGELLDNLRRLSPLAAVMEIVSNSKHLARAPLEPLLEELARRPPATTLHLLVDITAAGNAFSLERLLAPGLAPNVVLFLVESMQKFYEEGLELSSGGALHVLAADRTVVRDIRKWLCRLRGLNESGLDPLSAAKLARLGCDPSSLAEKVRIHARNTRRLAAYVEGLRSPFIQAVCTTERAGRRGGLWGAPYFWIVPSENTYSRANLLLSCLLTAARKYLVNIQNRDSFFFNNTVLHISRDYYQGLRVAPGTESDREIRLIEAAFREALAAAAAR